MFSNAKLTCFSIQMLLLRLLCWGARSRLRDSVTNKTCVRESKHNFFVLHEIINWYIIYFPNQNFFYIKYINLYLAQQQRKRRQANELRNILGTALNIFIMNEFRIKLRNTESVWYTRMRKCNHTYFYFDSSSATRFLIKKCHCYDPP